MEIIDDDPVVEECRHLWCDGGRVGDQYCPTCGGDGYETFDRSRLLTLGHNLAIAGAMQRMYNRGAFAVVMKDRYGHDEWQPNIEDKALR